MDTSYSRSTYTQMPPNKFDYVGFKPKWQKVINRLDSFRLSASIEPHRFAYLETNALYFD